MRVGSIIAALAAFAGWILSSAIPAQSELVAVDANTKGCDPSELAKWEQTCLIKGASVPVAAAIDAIEEACTAAQECHKHYRSDGPDFYNLPEDPPTSFNMQEEVETDTNQIVSSPFPHGISTPPARDEEKYVDRAPQCSWILACNLSNVIFIEIESARIAINNACQVAQYCSNQTFDHPVIGQGPHGEEATLNLGSSCGFNRKSQMTFDVCQSKFWNINREFRGLRDGRKFYPGNSTSTCDGTTIKVEHHNGGKFDQSPKAGVENCC